MRSSGARPPQALTYSGLIIPVVVSLSYFNYALCACIGAFFAIAGAIDLGSLASYLVYVRQAAMPINQFSQQVNIIMPPWRGRNGFSTPCPKRPRWTRATSRW